MIPTEINIKAKQLCLDAGVRPYCKKIHFYLYELNSPLPNGDCNSSQSMTLQDAVASFLVLSERFKGVPSITASFVKSICYYPRAIKLTRISDQSEVKINIQSECIPVRNWEDAQKLMESRCQCQTA